MKVITGYPVYIDNKRVGKAGNNWLYTEGQEPTDAEKKKQGTLGKIWDKTKGAWRTMTTGEQSDLQSFLTSGKIGNIAALLGLSAPSAPAPVATTPSAPPVAPAPSKEGMSMTTKIALIGGGAVVLGLVIWAITKK